jgi:hypothetical protein
MYKTYLQQIEYSLLESRLKFLREKGVRGDVQHLSDEFLKLMEDHWMFCSALTDTYAASEIWDAGRDVTVAEILKGEDWKYRDSDDDDEFMKQMFEKDFFADAE